MATALVTGSGSRVDAVASKLAADGFDVVTVFDGDPLTTVDLGAGIDCYVQLPVSLRPADGNLVERVHSFLSEGLLARYAAVGQLLSAVTPGARLVLVTGNSPSEPWVPDDQQSRLALLRVLAHAARAELAGKDVRVEVISGSRSDDDIVRHALPDAGTDPAPRVATTQAEQLSDKQYEDWRTEMMGLVQI